MVKVAAADEHHAALEHLEWEPYLSSIVSRMLNGRDKSGEDRVVADMVSKRHRTSV